MGNVQGLKKIVEDEAQEKKAIKPKQKQQPFYTTSLFWIRVTVAFILAMAAISYFFF